MQKLISFFLFTNLFSALAFAQISGRVIDLQTGAGLDGATIISNAGNAAVSNNEGYFVFSDDDQGITSLRFSFLGYKTDSINVSGKKLPLVIGLEPETMTIQELVISVSGLSESLMRSTGSVSSLTARNLQIHSGIVMNDAINQVPGLFMAGGGYNTNRLTIRGIGSRSPYASNRIRAYLDDIPLTTGDGSTSIEDIDLAAISRIEVLKGPSSAVYGSGLGGAVRMWSFQPVDDKFSLSLNSEAGSFGMFRSFARLSYKSSKGSLSLVYSNSHSEGFRQNSLYNRNSLLLNSNRIFNKTSIKLTLLYTGVEAQIPSSVTEISFTETPQLAAPNWLAIKGFEEYKRLLLGVTAESVLNSNFSNKLSVFTSISDPYESRPFNILDENSKSAGLREQLHFSKANFEFIVGGETFLEAYNWKIFETNSGSQGDLINDNREKRFFLNAFSLARYKSEKKLTVEFGLNMNILNYSIDDYFIADSIDISGNHSFAPVLSPRIGINLPLGTAINLHSSIGHGFSAPSPEETLLPDGQVNTELKPETGWNFDAGIRGKTMNGKIRYDLSLYHISLSNLLVTKRVSEEIFSGINAGKTNHSGLESMIRINLLSPVTNNGSEITFTTSFTASLNRFKDFADNGIDYSGKKLPGIPSSVMYNELRFKLLSDFEFIVIHKFTGKQLLNDSNTRDYNGFQLTDLRLAYSKTAGQKQHRFQIYGGVKNIFDKNYSGMVLVNAPSFGASEPRYYYPGLPRNYFVGVSVDLK